MQASVQAIAPTLSVVDGIPTTTSNEVAQHFGKQHKDVLEKIAALSREVGSEFTERNFPLSEYTDSTGRTLPAYLLTRDGFTLLAMGFTGKKALQFKLAYIAAFNKMEAQLSSAHCQLPTDKITPNQAQHLKELVQLIVESGKQTYGETYARLQRKFGVNSYLALPAAQFDAACAYLRGKVDGPSLAAIAQKHFPQVAALPAPAVPAISAETLTGLIAGGCFGHQAVTDIALAAAKSMFRTAARAPTGYGEQVANEIYQCKLPMADLRAIVLAANNDLIQRLSAPNLVYPDGAPA